MGAATQSRLKAVQSSARPSMRRVTVVSRGRGVAELLVDPAEEQVGARVIDQRCGLRYNGAELLGGDRSSPSVFSERVCSRSRASSGRTQRDSHVRVEPLNSRQDEHALRGGYTCKPYSLACGRRVPGKRPGAASRGPLWGCCRLGYEGNVDVLAVSVTQDRERHLVAHRALAHLGDQ
jgi:hypothetical protein